MREQQVRVVVMLTVGMENGRVSMPQPPGWPPGGRLSPQDQLWVWEAAQDGAGKETGYPGSQLDSPPSPLLFLTESTLSCSRPSLRPCFKHACALLLAGPWDSTFEPLQLER